MKSLQAVQKIQKQFNVSEDDARNLLAELSGLPPESKNFDDAIVNDAIAYLEKENAPNAIAPGTDAKAIAAAQEQSGNPLVETANALQTVRANVSATMTMAAQADADDASVEYLTAFNTRMGSNAARIEQATQQMLNHGLGETMAGTVGKEVQERRDRAANGLDQFFL